EDGIRDRNVTGVQTCALPISKGQVIDYYIRVAPVLLPHLKDRALTLKRYPNGVDGGFFYEKKCPSHRPEWVKTAPVWSDTNNARSEERRVGGEWWWREQWTDV